MITVPNRLLIAGEWVPASDAASVAIIDPATEEEIDRVPMATPTDVGHALEAANDGFQSLREVDAWSRSKTLRRAADLIRERAGDIAMVMTAEQGKPLAEARSEVLAAADQFDWYADEARRIYGRIVDAHTRDQRLLVLRQPIGPVAAFTPWNFPALLPARKLAPALAAGCSVILKPAHDAPRTAMCLASACQDAGLPAGAVNIVTGDALAISTQLIESDVVRKVSLTGSVPVGRDLLRRCAERIVPATLELGGHAPVLVFEDADIESAAELSVRAKFRNCGQVCISPTRFFVHERIADAFIELVTDRVRQLRLGPGAHPDTDMGPLANRRRLEAVEHLVQDAIQKGAQVWTGGRRPPDLPRGFFFEPTVLTGVTDDMELMRVEPFGPILPFGTFREFGEAIARANASEHGLAGYVFTRESRTAFLAAEALEVGMVGVNNMVIATAEAPFGGVKRSGFGREGGPEALDSYTVTKYVNLRL